MDHTHLLIAAAIATALLFVLRWIFTPRRRPQGRGAPRGDATAPTTTPPAEGTWDGAARRRRDLAT